MKPATALGSGIVPTGRVDWASLLRRVYLIDVLQCPRCRGRMRILADITDGRTARAILAHLGLEAEPRALARARDPTLDDA